jgi:hypothetical protein
MPLRLPLALFGPSLELTCHAQRKHTDRTPHSSARFKYLIIPIRTDRLSADLSNNTRFLKGLLRGGTMRRHSFLRPAFWDYPSSRAARCHQQNLNSGFDCSIRKGAILNWPRTPFTSALLRSFHDSETAPPRALIKQWICRRCVALRIISSADRQSVAYVIAKNRGNQAPYYLAHNLRIVATRRWDSDWDFIPTEAPPRLPVPSQNVCAECHGGRQSVDLCAGVNHAYSPHAQSSRSHRLCSGCPPNLYYRGGR